MSEMLTMLCSVGILSYVARRLQQSTARMRQQQEAGTATERGGAEEVDMSCKCGGIVLRLTGGAAAPSNNGSIYCHCQSCRKQHSAPLYLCLYVHARFITIVKGEALLKAGTAAHKLPAYTNTRYFCSQCGSTMRNELAPGGDRSKLMYGVFPATFDTPLAACCQAWQPTRHVHCQETMLALETEWQDNLPKYAANTGGPLMSYSPPIPCANK